MHVPPKEQLTCVSRLTMSLWRGSTDPWVAYVLAEQEGAPDHEWCRGASASDWDEMVALAADWHNQWKGLAGLVESPLYEAIPHPMLF